ncbi:hypothetical protein V8F06_010576 [Rhypophila decipiens]
MASARGPHTIALMPEAKINPHPRTRFHHPNDWLLLEIVSLDKSATGTSGVHYGTALSALRIIANNAPHSWLAADKDGVSINMEEDSILTASSFYFFVQPVTYDYPIILDFSDWRFPSGGPPEAWNTAALNPKLTVPGESPRSVNSDCKIIPLRADLHSTFDKKQWVIVPKHGLFVSHILVAEVSGLYPDYHDCVPFLHVAVKPENFQHFLFAAFAYIIINHRKLALGSGVPVKVVQYIEDKGEWETNTLDCQRLNARYGGGGLVHTRKRPMKKRRAEDVMELCNDKRQKQNDIPDASDTSSIFGTPDNSEPEMPDLWDTHDSEISNSDVPESDKDS